MFEKRGPGRPRKDERIEEKKAERAERRRRRTVGADFRGKLSLSESDMKKLCPKYELRWVNDVDNKPDTRYEEDWEYVSKSELGSRPGEDALSSEEVGDRVSKVVGTQESGQPMRAYLMKKPHEFYKEDQAAKEERRAEVEATMFRGKHSGAEDQYIPRNINVGIKR